MNSKPTWLKPDFIDGSIIPLNVNYLINHLYTEYKIRVVTNVEMWETLKVPKQYLEYEKGCNMVRFMKWQQSKEGSIENLLESGIPPEKIDPIWTHWNVQGEYFNITDGITRIRIFKKRGIKHINAKVFLDHNKPRSP